MRNGNSFCGRFLFLLYFFQVVFLFSLSAQQATNFSSAEIKIALKKLNTIGTALYIAAHPDDENTRLLSYLANEKCLRTCYLSINRGDGGQNLIGKEQGELLGLIRTNELLQARKIDGAEQFFTRANDFGYSKSPEETFRIWNHDSVLSDVVWIIRKLQPDVIIARFPTTGEGGHGHHTASGILSGEAFKAAADSTKFPEQLKYVNVWQAKSLWWNTFNFGANNTQRDDQYHFDACVFNTFLGKSYGQLAAESRSQHKSQGFGVPVNRGKLLEYFKPLDGDTSCHQLFCNADFSWNRLPGTEKIKSLCTKAENDFNIENPSLVVPVLVNAWKEIQKLKNEYWRIYKSKELEKLILACSGIWFESTADDYSAAREDSVKYKFSVIGYKEANAVIRSIKFDENADSVLNKKLEPNVLFTVEKKIKVGNDKSFTSPYWLNENHGEGAYVVDSLQQIGQPVNDAAYNFKIDLNISGTDFTFNCPLQYKWTDPVEGEKYRAFSIVPFATANFEDNVCMVINGKEKNLKVKVHSFTDSLKAVLELNAPAGYEFENPKTDVSIEKKYGEKIYSFRLKPVAGYRNDLGITTSMITAVLHRGRETSNKSFTEIKYNHITYQLVFKDAEIKLVPLQIETRGKAIGYIEGAGDEIPQCLSQLGYTVITLTDRMLADDDLSGYDAIVSGIRAYNTNENLPNYYQKLMEYVNKGGNYIVQYNTNSNLGKFSGQLGPYPFTISRERVTDEHASVSFTDTSDAVLKFPNKITTDDFNGWRQERGIYFAKDWDKNYRTLFACSDAGEKPLEGSTLIAHYGKGNFIYTGLAFFRQLPAGIPGAWRLFANLISQEKK